MKLSNKQKEFLKEFKDLLLKYNAEIDWDCDFWLSDTDGLYDARMVVKMVGQEENIDFDDMVIRKGDIDKILESGESNETRV